MKISTDEFSTTAHASIHSASQLINSARFKKEEDEIFFIRAQEVSLGHPAEKQGFSITSRHISYFAILVTGAHHILIQVVYQFLDVLRVIKTR